MTDLTASDVDTRRRGAACYLFTLGSDGGLGV